MERFFVVYDSLIFIRYIYLLNISSFDNTGGIDVVNFIAFFSLFCLLDAIFFDTSFYSDDWS